LRSEAKAAVRSPPGRFKRGGPGIRRSLQAKQRCVSGRIVAVTQTRLTAEQCQEIADRTMRSFESLEAAEVLERFGIQEHQVVDELVTDELTGMPCRRIVFATSVGEHEVHLTVAVSPEPAIVRPASRFKAVAELVAGWRGAAETADCTKVLKR
jgi:hypothetical protein